MKILKLFLIAIFLIGGIGALVWFMNMDSTTVSSDELESLRAKEWKDSISNLCSGQNWSRTKYESYQEAFHMERVTSDGEELSDSEERILNATLFSESCEHLYKSVDAFFQQTEYPDDDLRRLQEMFDFLATEKNDKGYESNSNLREAADFFLTYDMIMDAQFSSAAHYSRPLRPYGAASATAQQQKIRSAKYWSSHFSKNPTLRARVDGLETERREAEKQYYIKLEKCVEDHFLSNGRDLVVLNEDFQRFSDIAKDYSSTIETLRRFKNGGYKKR